MKKSSKWRKYITIFALALFAVPASASQENVPKQILKEVASVGSRQVIQEIWANEKMTKQLLDGVSNADKSWLAVARILAPATDSGTSEELNDALAAALLKKPQRVLPILQQLWWSNGEICVFGTDSELPGGVSNYIEKLRDGLVIPSAKNNLLSQRCLRGLVKTRKALNNAH